VSDGSVDLPESLKQRKRQSPDVRRRDKSPNSAPIAEGELRLKGSRKIADGKKAYRNLKRGAELFRPPSPAGFARLSLEEVPDHLPKAEVAKDTDGQMTARAYQPRQDRSNGM
jgi:hypothetical protein